MSSLITGLSQLVAWVLAGFYSVVPNYAFAIVAIGITFMALIIPFNLKSTRSMLAMQKLQPKMKQLQQQHKNDKLALQQAISELYKEEGVSPLGGCLPALAPMPLLYVLYHVISGLSHVQKVVGKGKGLHGAAGSCPNPFLATAVKAGTTTGYCRAPLYVNSGTRMYHALMAGAPKSPASAAVAAANLHALGLNLSVGFIKAVDDHLGFGAVFGALLLVLFNIAANFYQQVQITNLNPAVRQSQQANPQMRMMRYLPIMLGILWINLSSAAILYYGTSAVFRVVQQWMMYHYDPKVKLLVAKDDHDIDILDAKLNELERKGVKVSESAGQQSPKFTPPRAFVEPKPQPRARANGSNGKPAPPPARATSTTGAATRPRNRKRKGR